MTSDVVLALLIVLGLLLPVSVILGRAGTAQEEHSEETPHEGLNCQHCDALTVLPVSAPRTIRVSVPRQPGAEDA